MNDRNKTELTHNLTRYAVLWLDAHGFKPVETEVSVDDRWIADVASVSVPTLTELINMKFIKRRPSYPYRWDVPESKKNPVVIERWEARCAEWDEKRRSIPERLTVLVEVKTSVGDFRGDRKWKREWPTNLCYLAMPEGMINETEYPKGWGVVLFSTSGAVRKIIPSEIRAVSMEQQGRVIYSVAIRRDHRTRHAEIREWSKRVRLEDVEKKSVARLRQTVNLIKYYVLEGKSLSDAKSFTGFYAEIPKYIEEMLDEMKKRIRP